MDQLEKFKSFYAWAETVKDPRTHDWLFVKSPVPTYTLCIAYIIFVTKVGPWMMRNRQPMNLKWALVVYNLVLSLVNAHIFYELIVGSSTYNFPCQPVNTETDQTNEMRVASALWLYYVSKLIEFMDTIFFVLRKKNGQISFLHVYHHSTMPMLWWIGVRWFPGGTSSYPPIFNSLVHVVMYFYYGMAALGPQYQKYLWWKRYLTLFQMVQFGCLICVAFANILLTPSCGYPEGVCWALLFYAASFLLLFGKFYVQTYKERKTTRGFKKKIDGEEKEMENKEVLANGLGYADDGTMKTHRDNLNHVGVLLKRTISVVD